MPQTRFVLKHALEHGLKPLVVINKIDRQRRPPARGHRRGLRPHGRARRRRRAARLPGRLHQRRGRLRAHRAPTTATWTWSPLLDAIIDHVPRAGLRPGRARGDAGLHRSTTRATWGASASAASSPAPCTAASKILVIKNDGSRYQANVKQLFTFEGMGRPRPTRRTPATSCAVVGVEDADIGDMFTCRTRAGPARPDPGGGADDVGRLRGLHQPARRPGRHDRRRPPDQGAAPPRGRVQHLDAHHRDARDKSGMEVAGRGVLHLSVLMETMRREGYEFQVGRPQVILKERGRQDARAHRAGRGGRARASTPARSSRSSAAAAAR